MIGFWQDFWYVKPDRTSLVFQASQMRQDSFGGLLTHQALADGAPVVHQIGNGQHFATGQLQTLGRIIAEHAKPNSQGFGCLGELLATQLIEVDPSTSSP